MKEARATKIESNPHSTPSPSGLTTYYLSATTSASLVSDMDAFAETMSRRSDRT